jgi:hypothetical protein
MNKMNLCMIQIIIIICIFFLIYKNDKKYKEGFDNKKKCRTGLFYFTIFNTVLGIYSIYLSLVINNGFNLFHILAACFIPYLYIPYAMFYREKLALKS